MIAVILTTISGIVVVFVVVGPMGTHDALTPLERLVFGAVYAAAAWPICYSMNVVALYFLRLRALREIAAALTLLALFEAFPYGALAYTVESLVHPPPTQGILELYLRAATIAVACNLLFLYVVYQRLSRPTAPGAVTTAAGSGTAAAVQEVHSAADPAVLPGTALSGAESGSESSSGDDDEPPSRKPPDEDEAEPWLPPQPVRQSRSRRPRRRRTRTRRPPARGNRTTGGGPAQRYVRPEAPEARHDPDKACLPAWVRISYTSRARITISTCAHRRVEPGEDALLGCDCRARGPRDQGAPQLLGRHEPRAATRP